MLPDNAGIRHLAHGQIANPHFEVFSIAVDASQEQLIAEHPVEIQLIGRHLNVLQAAGDAGPHEHAIDAQHAHGAEGNGASSR